MEGDQGVTVTSSSLHSLSSLLAFVLLLSVSYGYCYIFIKKLPKGLPRLISFLGVFYSLFRVPWYFPSSIFVRGLTSFFISWVSSFKLLLFFFDKGDLMSCNNYVDFVLVATLPLKIKSKCSSLSKVPFAQKVLAILMPFLVLSLDHGMLIFLTLMVVVYLGRTLMPHLEVVPILNEPHRATSLQVFWGKRWNRVSSDVLRHAIYNPTLEALASFIGTSMGKVFALVVTLVVSGIMHEIMFYHMTCGMKPTWEVTRFFVLQGLSMAFEIAIKRFWIRTLSWPPLSPIVSVPLTLGFLLVTSYWLLVLPVVRIAGRECDSKSYGIKLVEKVLHYIIW